MGAHRLTINLTPDVGRIRLDNAMRGLVLGIIFLAVSSLQAGEILLPKPSYRGVSVEEAITKRRSQRAYTADSLSLEEISQILFAAQGITAKKGSRALRAAPSAGALYPLELYLVVNRVRGLSAGIYHYQPEGHKLEPVELGSFGERLSQACLGQSMPRDAAASVVITAVPQRTRAKYGDRAMRYIYLEAGHVSENIYLECVSLGLGTVGIGAFYDDEIIKLIGGNRDEEIAVFVNAIGVVSKQGKK